MNEHRLHGNAEAHAAQTHNADLGNAETDDPETHGAADTEQRMTAMLDAAGACVLVSIGHRLKLFDTLAGLPPATSADIAGAAGLHERYVSEWLRGMVTARLVAHHSGTDCYALTSGAAAVVAGAGPENLARQARYVTMMGEVADRIADCFTTGGGLGYEHYPEFHHLMAEESSALFDAALLDAIVPLTGMHARLVAGANVLDVGCGAGHAVAVLAAAYPRSTFVGLDSDAGVIERARRETAALPNAAFRHEDAARLADVARFDLITAFDAVHDQAAPDRVLGAVRRALRPDGTFLMGDINASSDVDANVGKPLAAFLYAVSLTHCMSVSLAQQGVGLGAMWGMEAARRMLMDAGFRTVTHTVLDQDPLNAYTVAR